ncbi:hypothetical protein B5M09_004662 [Aphanomyces astaci]|uniref:U2A'/phosphoprotein 32 family A C-terminal domain-containing protein n=1 Tax=Aphanomyces astaci TaxID=112090 RepID=A0A3R7WIN9_APHAT|nr:hypothetical protein B5M09_004662 [Aphanomyces astaci]
MPAAIMQSNNNDEHDIVVANQTQGGSSYTARLMDDEAIQSLRRDLREYEVNIARHGHLQEYVASKPVQVSRIELLQSTSPGNTYDPPTTPSTHGTPRQTSRRQHPSSVIRHRDSFATAMVKHHLGFDPLMKTDDDIENQDITPIAAPATTGDALLLPCRPASATSTSCQTTLPSKPTSCRPATVNVGKGEGARQRLYTKVHSEEKASLQGSTLVSLELLSLSHNKLQSLEHFQHLVNLVELTSMAHLRSFPHLVHVSVFGNQLGDLDDAMQTCRHLLKLRGLDLDGNPCARVKGYKYHVLRRLPRLKELDGLAWTMLITQRMTTRQRPSSGLHASVDMYKAAASDSAVTSLVDEITRLRIENNNIPILQAEIHQLKATIRHAPPNYDDDDNQQPGTINDSSKSVKALQTIQKTKLDMQQDRVARLYDLFCRPIYFLTGQQRPSTSAGVLQTFAGPRQSSVPSSVSSSAGRRQLHTSAGPRPRSKGAGCRVSSKKTPPVPEDSPTDQVNNNTGCPDLLVLHS